MTGAGWLTVVWNDYGAPLTVTTPMTNDVAPPADATIRVASKHKTTKPPDGVFTEIGLALDTLFRSVFGSAPSSEAN